MPVCHCWTEHTRGAKKRRPTLQGTTVEKLEGHQDSEKPKNPHTFAQHPYHHYQWKQNSQEECWWGGGLDRVLQGRALSEQMEPKGLEQSLPCSSPQT